MLGAGRSAGDFMFERPSDMPLGDAQPGNDFTGCQIELDRVGDVGRVGSQALVLLEFLGRVAEEGLHGLGQRHGFSDAVQRQHLDVPGAHGLAVAPAPVLEQPDRAGERHLGVLDRCFDQLQVGLGVGRVPAVDGQVGDEQPGPVGVVDGHDDVGGEVLLARGHRVAEAHQHGPPLALDRDGEVRELLGEVHSDGVPGAFHEVPRAATARPVVFGGAGDDHADVDFVERADGVTVGDARRVQIFRPGP
jgi:hypothetical protein